MCEGGSDNKKPSGTSASQSENPPSVTPSRQQPLHPPTPFTLRIHGRPRLLLIGRVGDSKGGGGGGVRNNVIISP